MADAPRSPRADGLHRRRSRVLGLDFAVTPAVLIPRPETEFIVEEALALARASIALDALTVADIGTGCGNIAVSLAHEVRRRPCHRDRRIARSTDVAGSNAQRHGVADGSTSSPRPTSTASTDTFDLIAANPPYVKDGDKAGLSADVRHEPDVALFGGSADSTHRRRARRGGRDAAPQRLAGDGVRLRPGRRCAPARISKAGAATRAGAADLQGIPRTAVIERIMTDCLFCKIIARPDSRAARLPGRSSWWPSRTSTRRRRCTC